MACGSGGNVTAVDVETGQRDAAGQSGPQVVCRHEQDGRCRQRRRRARPADGVVVARLRELDRTGDRGGRFVGLRYRHQSPGRRREVVEHGCVARRRGHGGLFTHRHDQELIQGLDRPLRAGIEAADRLDQVADELDADGPDLVGGIDVEDAAAHAVLAVIVDRILAVVSGLGEQRRERQRIDLRAGAHAERAGDEYRRRGQALQERRRRGDDDPSRAGGHRQQRPGARRAHAHMRRQRPVRIGLQ